MFFSRRDDRGIVLHLHGSPGKEFALPFLTLIAPTAVGWNFMSLDLSLVGLARTFNTADDIGLVRLSFFNQFLDALGISFRSSRQTLQRTRLTGGLRTCAARRLTRLLFRNDS
jgi:hypothetical protein